MTDEQKYLFDLQGYLQLPGLISAREVAVFNAEIDRLLTQPDEQYPGNAARVDHPTKDGASGPDAEIRIIIECGPAFEALIDHPAILPYVQELLTPGPMRLTHSAALIRGNGMETPLHRGRVPILGQFEYRFEQGRIHCAMIRVVIYLTDIAPGQGGLSVIPASHKSNFPCAYFIKGDPDNSPHPDDVPVLRQLHGKAGDVVLFTEDLTHGGQTNRTGKSRRGLYLTYQPGYMPNWYAPASDELLARLPPQRRALVETPHY